MSYADRIKPTHDSIGTYLDNLRRKQYQIPTFQREVVWKKDNVKKLWDSIYKFYPIGSILVWRTDLKLQNYRKIGGHIIADDVEKTEYQYILDGQQRTTSLLTSLYGGKIEGREGFDPTLYVDITISDNDENQNFKKRFLFWSDIDDKEETVKRNIPRKKRFDEGLIVKIRDIKENYNQIEEKIYNAGYQSYSHEYRENLRKIKHVLDNYRIPFIELRGIQVSEVCEIFERINQEGRPLNIFDIVVAKTFRLETKNSSGFYLRELIDDFRDERDGSFVEIDNLTYLHILAIIIRQNIEKSGIWNITDRYLNEIKSSHIEEIWPEAKISILKTFDFFENHLNIKGPKLIPFRYFYMSIASYFYQNKEPNYKLLKKYFWFYSFHTEELLRNTTHLRNHVDWLGKKKKIDSKDSNFSTFVLNKNDLRNSSYSSRGRLSRAILSLLSSQKPKDWKHPDRSVMSAVYYLLTDKPNLHHIFPKGFLKKCSANNQLDKNSLMNIAFIPQITNLEISDNNPVEYLKNYDLEVLEEIFKSHLIPEDLIKWCRNNNLPENALDIFIEKRINLFVDCLKNKLDNIPVNVIDTKGNDD